MHSPGARLVGVDSRTVSRLLWIPGVPEYRACHCATAEGEDGFNVSMLAMVTRRRSTLRCTTTCATLCYRSMALHITAKLCFVTESAVAVLLLLVAVPLMVGKI